MKNTYGRPIRLTQEETAKLKSTDPRNAWDVLDDVQRRATDRGRRTKKSIEVVDANGDVIWAYDPKDDQ